MRVLRICVFITCLVCLAGTHSLAQTDSDTQRSLSGTAELSFVSTSGNSDTETIGLGAELQYEPGRWRTATKLKFIRSEANNTLNAHSFNAILQGTRQMSGRIGLYSKAGYLRDRFAGIDDRYAAEGGVSWQALLESAHQVTAEGGFGWTRELRATAEHRTLGTANSSVSYFWLFSETNELRNEASATFVVDDSNDWRFTNDLSLSAALNTLFSLKLTHQVGFLNDPVPGFEKTDIKVSAAVVAKF